jgi:dipeptidyl aminopeptidase/acylaminoacyl peptidase
MRAFQFAIAAAAAVSITTAAFARPAEPADVVKAANVSQPDLSPDGTRVAYTVRTADLEEDTNTSHIWIAATDGSSEYQLTGREGESETSPQFSPDGKWLGFLSSRGKGEDIPTRLWLLPLAGGEARAIEGVKGSVSDYAWSPDGTKLALIVKDPKPEPKDEKTKDRPQPIVIDRLAFKRDYEGFLDNRRERLWLYDLGSGSLTRLTDGDFDESSPAFSPDGSEVAFLSKRGPDPDRTDNSDIFVADLATPGDAPRQLTTYEGADYQPAWSPDGESIAYLRGGALEKIWYAVSTLAVIDADGGTPNVLTPDLDRNVFDPVWNEDGSAVRVMVEDDGREYLARVTIGQQGIETLAKGDFVLDAPSAMQSGKMALTKSDNFTPAEVYVFADGELTKVSKRNDEWLAGLEFGSFQRTAFASADGTEVHGFIYLPPGYTPGHAYPAVLNLHGGPASQFGHSWDDEILWQLLSGKVVITPNPRGSTGRGEAFAMAGHGAWGALDVQDVLAAVDDAVAKGIADPDRLAVSGWSYGGMLTNYVIASDTRFKAAVSGASISNIITGFGHDQYIREYLYEIGTPWENLEGWMAISYPFFENQRIVTPTLFMVGEEDVNVPAIASEQMYQALKVRGIDTQLVLYPGEYHGFTRPSFRLDRIKRWNAWIDKYLAN